MKEECPGIRV